MPIYEFYCPACHKLFSFFSKRIDTSTQPVCPSCNKQKLTREVSSFALGSSGDMDTNDPMGDLPVDENKMEQAAMALANEAEHINEDDPRQAAQLMRKFSKMSGLEYGDTMQDALSRMEKGEDPEKIESEMGALMDEEDPFMLPSKKGEKCVQQEHRRAAPRRDETLYELCPDTC